MAAAGTLDRGHDDEVLRASRVSRFSLSSPGAGASVGATCAVAGLSALVLSFGPAGLGGWPAAQVALFALLVPCLAQAPLSLALMRRWGGTITTGRVFLLGLTDAGVILAFVTAGSLLRWPAGDIWLWGLLVGVSFAPSVNMLVLGATSLPRLARAALPGLVVPAVAASALVAADVARPGEALLAGAFTGVFLLAAALWARVVVAPFRRAFNEDGLALLQALLDAWAGWSKGADGSPARGTLSMEAFFARHGQARDVGFQAAHFRRPGSDPVLWFVPELHPGPYADLGGSDLPAKAAASLGTRRVATFHGASTHDDNPCSRGELAKVTAAVEPAIRAATEDGSATRARRFTSHGVSLLAQSLGINIVLVHTRAPGSSDDIDRSVGAEVEAALVGARETGATLLDAHNCVGADLGRTEQGSKEHADLKAAALAASEGLAAEPRGPFRVGYAQRLLSAERARQYAVGREGVSATVIEAGSQKAAYVLIDGNNLKGGLRDPILRAIEEIVDLGEVMTTDNHAVNTTMGADNEVGADGDNTPLIEEVASAVRGAVADLQPSHVAWALGSVPGVRVFGPGLTVRMSEAINAAVGRMIPVYLIATGAAIGACAALAILVL
jgi:putative membrane protein